MQAEELAVRDSTLAVVRMKRREMEVVVSICVDFAPTTMTSWLNLRIYLHFYTA